MKPPVSVANKELTVKLNPLESTLMKNRGVGGVMVNQLPFPRPSDPSRRSSVHSASLRYPCSPLLLSSKRRPSVETSPSLIHHPKEPHAVVATQSHPQHGLLQAHPLVAVSAGDAPHLLLRRIPRRHVRRNHARHAAVHPQIQFRRPGLHPRRRRGSPPHRSRPFRRPSQVLQLRRLQIALRQT